MSESPKELDKILQDAFTGLYGKELSDNGLDTYFAPMEDSYGILKDSLKQDILDWHNSETVKELEDILNSDLHASSVVLLDHIDDGTCPVVEGIKSLLEDRISALQSERIKLERGDV